MAESLAKVRAAFAAWRTRHPGKGRVYPQSLRDRALAVPWTGDDAELSAALGLSNVTVLQNWRAQSKGQKDAETDLQAVGPFVEVGTVGGLERAFGAGQEKPVLEVALESRSGGCLRIRGVLDHATVLGLARVAVEAGGSTPCSK